MNRPFFAVLACYFASVASAQPALRHVESDANTGSSSAVLVGDVPLVHTAQLVPSAGGDAASQVTLVIDQLGQVLRKAGSDASRVAKLNVYVARAEITEVVNER